MYLLVFFLFSLVQSTICDPDLTSLNRTTNDSSNVSNQKILLHSANHSRSFAANDTPQPSSSGEQISNTVTAFNTFFTTTIIVVFVCVLLFAILLSSCMNVIITPLADKIEKRFNRACSDPRSPGK
ncbi:unnamed protein product [Caenorhabditis brenneri]